MIAELVARHEGRLRAFAIVASVAALAALIAPRASTHRATRSVTLPTLIAPFAPGREVARGYVLSHPHRGHEGEIVYTARGRDGGRLSRVELHIVDRGVWTGVRESRHYGIAYELPASDAPRETCEAVTEAFASAIRANDRAAVPVAELRVPEDARADRVEWAQRAARSPRLVGLALVVLTLALATLRRGGALAASMLLLALGLALRLPHLDVPFDRDQDIQRLFTGHLSMREILTGAGLRDRHPPLYFVVLHVAQWFGQSETVTRMPAVIAGALVGPGLVASAAFAGRRVALAALAGLVTTVSYAFVASSREVSSIPLFSLFLLAMAASVARHSTAPSRASAVAIVVSHALALATYYTAVFPIAGELLVLAALGESRRPTLRKVLLGCLVGAPAIVLAIAAFLRDRGAREAAASAPSLAWGDHSSLELVRAMASQASRAAGPIVAILALLAGLVAVRRRDPTGLMPWAIALTSFVGIALLAPVARVQAYYVMTALPALLVVPSLVPAFERPRVERAYALVFAAAVATSCFPSAGAISTLYAAPRGAFAADMARTIAATPERRVATVVHYDATSIAYYLARTRGVPVDWSTLERGREGFHVRGTRFDLIPLVESHGGERDPEAIVMTGLERLEREGSFLVVARESLGFEGVTSWLRHCPVLVATTDVHLHRCPSRAERERADASRDRASPVQPTPSN